MKKFLEYGIYAVIFLLPWQTVWIIQEAMIGPEGAMGVWQYGTLKIYAIEFLIVFLTLPLLFTALKNTIMSANNRLSLLSLGDTRDTLRRESSLGVLIFVFLFFAGFSILWSADALVALFAWIRLLEGAFLFFLIRLIPVRWSLMFGAWIAAAVIQSGLGIWQFAVQEVVAHKFLGIAAHHSLILGNAVVEAGDRRWLRAYGAFPHPNLLGAYLAVGMVMCATMLVRAKEKMMSEKKMVSGTFLQAKTNQTPFFLTPFFPFFLLIASQIILIALLLTFSRSAWLALGVAAGVTFFCLATVPPRRFTFRRSKGQWFSEGIHPIVVMIVVSVVTIGIFTSVFSEEVATRLGITSSRLEEQSLSERISLLDRAWNHMPLITWLTGTGVGNFTNTLFHYEEEQSTPQPWYVYQPIHNAFLMIFAELGIIGIVLFLAFLFMIVRTLYYSSSRVMGYGLLVALLVPAFFDHFLWTLPFGVFFASSTLGISWKRFP